MCGSRDLPPGSGAGGSRGARPDERFPSHRGPDGEGYVLWEPGQEPRYFSRLPEGPPFPRGRLALANRRLSIIDLSDRGRQPMANEDGSIWVTFNGEIYNYLELMTELKGRGHRFQSSCDTEVILHAYEEWGEDCLARFNGMWAFALWDGRQKALFCAGTASASSPSTTLMTEDISSSPLRSRPSSFIRRSKGVQ